VFGASIGSGDPYPCQDCGCGCAGATECWTACCCHTPHQRLVWALERGILPPMGVRFTDADWIAAANAIKPGSATCGACVARLKAGLAAGIALVRAEGSAADRSGGSCCSSRRSAPVPSACCSTDGADTACDAGPCTRGPRSLPCASALGCKGGAAHPLDSRGRGASGGVRAGGRRPARHGKSGAGPAPLTFPGHPCAAAQALRLSPVPS
jgi:hypothetical protein